jgi:predicted Zn-dependent peptidase
MTALILLCVGLALAEPEPEAALAEGEETEATEDVVGPVRVSPPAVRPSAWLEQAEPVEYALSDGARALYVHVPGVRKVEVTLVLHQGTVELGGESPLTKGLGNYSDLATTTRSAQDLELLGDLNDILAYSYIGHHDGGFGLTVPLEELALGIEVLADVVHNPAYPKADIARELREQRMYLAAYGPASLRSASWAAVAKAWTPADHPYGARPDLDALKKIKSTDLLALHQRWLTTSAATVLVVGDVPWETVQPMVKTLVDGVGVEAELPKHAGPPAHEGTRVIGVDMPGQRQAGIRLRFAGPEHGHADRAAFYQANWVFGGHFLSRLNANLREDKGFTYGSRSSYVDLQALGQVSVSVDVKVENTGAAITEIEAEIGRLVSDGVTAVELDMARQDAVSSWNGTRETAGSADRFYSQLLSDRESVADARAAGAALEAVDSEGAQGAMNRWMGPDAARLWVVAGDRKQLEAQLDALGWTVEWITPEQAILGTF